MSQKSREVKHHKDGSSTEKIRYTDGSGHDVRYKPGGLLGRKVISEKSYRAPKKPR